MYNKHHYNYTHLLIAHCYTGKEDNCHNFSVVEDSQEEDSQVVAVNSPPSKAVGEKVEAKVVGEKVEAKVVGD
jgi:hypothetical protein